MNNTGKALNIISKLRKPTFVFNMASGDNRPGARQRREAAAEEIIALVERDEYHTMEELYHYRMLYNAHAAYGWWLQDIPVVKSWRHSDGELCFGGGWFIVQATLPGVGQVSNHYKGQYWDLFTIPEGEPEPYDGHTPEIAAARLEAAL